MVCNQCHLYTFYKVNDFYYLSMSIKLKYIVFLLYCACSVHAQTCDTAAFQRSYWFQNTKSSPAENIVSDKNGNNYILSNTAVNPESNSSSIDGVDRV